MWSISLQFAWEQLQCRRMGLGLLVNDCFKEGSIVTILILLDLISSSLSAFEKPLYGRWRKCRQNSLLGSIFNLSHFWRIQNQFWCILHGAVFKFSRFLRFKIGFEALIFKLFQHFLVFRIMFDSFWGTHFPSKVVGPQLSVSSMCLPYT